MHGEYCAVAFKNLELSSASINVFENAEWHTLQEWKTMSHTYLRTKKAPVHQLRGHGL